jgi:hypothetical protein
MHPLKFSDDVDRAALKNDSAEVDRLCIGWLRSLCTQHGRDGDIAKNLLKSVGELLQI